MSAAKVNAEHGELRGCGACGYWAHNKKRNCSNQEAPVYYAECLYPVDELVLPHCVTFEETSAGNGKNCPCFVPLTASA